MLLSFITLLRLSTLIHASPAADIRRRPNRPHRHHTTTVEAVTPPATTPTTSTISAPTASPTSSPPCQAKVFNLPWNLTDITIFTPANQTSAQSTHGTISFHFSDTNAQLRLGTDCSGTVIDGVCGGDDGGYVMCENGNVAFRLQQGVVMVERAYVDDCLGPWPYNSGVAFGQNSTELAVTTEAAGTMAMQEQLLVEITQMA